MHTHLYRNILFCNKEDKTNILCRKNIYLKTSVSYSGVEGKSDMFVVASGSEGDLRQSEIILGTGQCGVQHQYVALEKRRER